MSERGYAVIVKLNAKPVQQYASGNSVIFQGDTVEEVTTMIAKAISGGIDDTGALIVGYLCELALAQAAGAALSSPTSSSVEASGGGEDDAPAAGAATGDEPASPALLAVVASKTGESAEDLAGITTRQAKQKLAIAKSKATKAAEVIE